MRHARSPSTLSASRDVARTVTAVADVDGDPVTYGFTVYSDAALSTEVASVTSRSLLRRLP